MVFHQKLLSNKNQVRTRVDRFFRIFISLAGWTILIVLGSMIWHLLKVSLPLADTPEVKKETSILFQQQARVEFVGDILEGESVFTLSSECHVNAYNLDKKELVLKFHHSIPFPCDTQLKILSFQGQPFLFSLNHDGLLRIERLKNTKRRIEREFVASYLVGKKTNDAAGWEVAISNAYFMVAIRLPEYWQIFSLSRSNLLEVSESQIPSDDDIELLPQFNKVIVIVKKGVDVFDQTSKLRQSVPIQQPVNAVLSTNLSHGFVTSTADGKMQKWGVVNREGQFVFERHFETKLDGKITGYWQDSREHMGLIITDENKLIMFNDLSGDITHTLNLEKTPQFSVYVEDKVYLYFDGRFEVIRVTNPSASINFSSLWSPLKYLGYEQPSYVWQSAASEGLEPKYSLIPLFIGSLKSAFYALLIAVPMALGAAIYSAYFLHHKQRAWIKPTIELLEAVPSVVIGFVIAIWLTSWNVEAIYLLFTCLIMSPLALIIASYIQTIVSRRFPRFSGQGQELIFVPVFMLFFLIIAHVSWDSIVSEWIVKTFDGGNEPGFAGTKGTIVVAIALGIAIIPTIFTLAEDAIYGVPLNYKQASFALGATQLQTLQRVVLKAALPGIVSAVMLGFGRAFGETMIVLMITGNTPIADWGFLSGLRTLGANLAIELPHSEVGSGHYRILFLMALLLFCFTFVINTIAELVRSRFYSRYDHV